jgi:hypothetical protein
LVRGKFGLAGAGIGVERLRPPSFSATSIGDHSQHGVTGAYALIENDVSSKKLIAITRASDKQWHDFA